MQARANHRDVVVSFDYSVSQLCHAKCWQGCGGTVFKFLGLGILDGRYRVYCKRAGEYGSAREGVYSVMTRRLQSSVVGMKEMTSSRDP